MNEKFNPQDYRDNLAKDLKKLRSEGEEGQEQAKNTLKGSNMPWYHSKANLRHEDLRYKTSKDIHKHFDLERFKDLPSDPDKFRIIINNVVEFLHNKTYPYPDTIERTADKIFIKDKYAAIAILESSYVKGGSGYSKDDRYYDKKGILIVDNDLNYGLSEFDTTFVSQRYVKKYNPIALSYDPEFDDLIDNTLERYPGFLKITDLNKTDEGKLEITVSLKDGGSKVFNVLLNQKLTEKEIEENINRKIKEMNKEIRNDHEDKQGFGA